jgi:hypothetical protein
MPKGASRVPEEGRHEPPGPEARKRQGGFALRKGGFQKSFALKLERLEEAHPEVELWAEETRGGWA